MFTCPILKLEIETLKEQLTCATSLSCTCSSSFSDRGVIFKKNPHVTERNRKGVFFSKAICHYYGDKGHIRSLCHIRNIQVQNGKIRWILKCTPTNPRGPTS